MKLPPAPFPFLPRFQNGPRRQGCAPENLFKPRKRFSSAAHQTRALDRLRAVPKIFHREGKGLPTLCQVFFASRDSTVRQGAG
jgi:hypothetical protein